MVAADENHIITSSHDIVSVTEQLNNYFDSYPKKDTALWLPIVNGKTRLSFEIPRIGYQSSKKYKDTSDLFYLSKINNRHWSIYNNKQKNLNLLISNNSTRISYNKNFLRNTHLGFFAEKKKNNPIGITISKEYIVNNDSLFRLNIDYPLGGYIYLKSGFSKLSDDEKYEIFTNLNYESKKDYVQIELGKTWFDFSEGSDLTMSIYNENSDILPAISTTNYNKKRKFTAGLDKIKSTKNFNIFIRLSISLLHKYNNLNADVEFKSNSHLINFNRFTLRNYRKKSAHKIWREQVQFK